MHRTRRLALLGFAFLLGGCESGDLTTGLLPGGVRTAASLVGTTSAGFHFLPPLAPQADPAGPLDHSLEPIVEICETAACDAPHATFGSTAATGAETVRASDTHFIVNWNTGETGAVAGTDYLVRVRVGTSVVGSTWVRIAANGREARAAGGDQVLGLVDGRTLPIRFWIGEGAVAPATVVRVAVTPAAAEIGVGGTQQYVATAYDANDAVVAGFATTWSSSDDGIATIAPSGLATGLAAGQVAITATIQGVHGTAALAITAGSGDPPPSGTWTFTTCGATGAFGPSDVACTDAYAESPLAGAVEVTNGIQYWEVPATGTYRITATGARGASAAPSQRGGAGAVIAGDIPLDAGDVLAIVVGQQGSGQGSGWSGGGGGGSFVVRAGEPLVIAGGGGGTHNLAKYDGCNANTSPYGVVGAGEESMGYCLPGEHRGDQVSFGGDAGVSFGSGGAGFAGNGQDDRTRDGATLGQGGRSWANGMVGGVAPDTAPCSGPRSGFGGFGGGGSGEGCDGGGGGGGYSGGDGGFFAGGGGSYVMGNAYVYEGHSTGDIGSVVIARVQ